MGDEAAGLVSAADPSAVQDASISNTPATGQVFAADPAKLYAATPIYKKQVRPESRPCLA